MHKKKTMNPHWLGAAGGGDMLNTTNLSISGGLFNLRSMFCFFQIIGSDHPEGGAYAGGFCVYVTVSLSFLGMFKHLNTNEVLNYQALPAPRRFVIFSRSSNFHSNSFYTSSVHIVSIFPFIAIPFFPLFT